MSIRKFWRALGGRKQASFNRSLVPPSRPSVVGLFGIRRPLAVVRRVWAVVVDAFEAVVRPRPRTHVSKECCKAVLPPIAYSNPAPSISLKGAVLGVIAALFHSHPCVVFGRVRAAVCGDRFHELLAAVASARLRFARTQELACSGDFDPAIAAAEPQRLAVLRPSVALQNNETTKALADHVNRVVCHV